MYKSVYMLIGNITSILIKYNVMKLKLVVHCFISNFYVQEILMLKDNISQKLLKHSKLKTINNKK